MSPMTEVKSTRTVGSVNVRQVTWVPLASGLFAKIIHAIMEALVLNSQAAVTSACVHLASTDIIVNTVRMSRH